MSRRNNEKMSLNSYIPLPPTDFYLKVKLQSITSNLLQYFANVEIKNFDLIYHDLHHKELDHSLEHYPTIFKNDFKCFDKHTTDYLMTFARRSERDDIFFEKSFDCERFLRENPHIFLSAMKKKILL